MATKVGAFTTRPRKKTKRAFRRAPVVPVVANETTPAVSKAQPGPLSPELAERVRKLERRMMQPFGSIITLQGARLHWAQLVALMAQHPGLETSRENLNLALQILLEEVERQQEADHASGAARRRVNVDEIYAAIDAGASVGKLMRDFKLSRTTARRYQRLRKKRRRAQQIE
jgi:hypothetical protein